MDRYQHSVRLIISSSFHPRVSTILTIYKQTTHRANRHSPRRCRPELPTIPNFSQPSCHLIGRSCRREPNCLERRWKQNHSCGSWFRRKRGMGRYGRWCPWHGLGRLGPLGYWSACNKLRRHRLARSTEGDIGGRAHRSSSPWRVQGKGTRWRR